MNQTDYQKALGKNVRIRRLQLELSQEDLSMATGFSVNHLSRLERGLANITVPHLNEIAGALKKKSSTLLPS